VRIGVFGGTFDPPHKGHLELAKAAIDQLGLDDVLLVPANRNPLKRGRSSPGAQRLEMVRLAVLEEPKMAVSDIEILRGGPSYAVETLSDLSYAQPADYWFLIGADAVRNFGEWKQPQRLVRLARLGVALRSGQTREDVLARVPEEFHEKIDWIDMPRVEISSSEIRDRVARGRSPVPWVSHKVFDYIEKNKLYR
jgi:nicotinate-nucleotide adenylyltransferase